jgi:hypothetical protein
MPVAAGFFKSAALAAATAGDTPAPASAARFCLLGAGSGQQ